MTTRHSSADPSTVQACTEVPNSKLSVIFSCQHLSFLTASPLLTACSLSHVSTRIHTNFSYSHVFNGLINSYASSKEERANKKEEGVSRKGLFGLIATLCQVKLAVKL